jgi:hypothetical protein
MSNLEQSVFSQMVAVVYDGDIAVYTPLNLWTSTGVSPNLERYALNQHNNSNKRYGH